MWPLRFFFSWQNPKQTAVNPLQFFVFLQQLRATQRCDRLGFSFLDRTPNKQPWTCFIFCFVATSKSNTAVCPLMFVCFLDRTTNQQGWPRFKSVFRFLATTKSNTAVWPLMFFLDRTRNKQRWTVSHLSFFSYVLCNDQKQTAVWRLEPLDFAIQRYVATELCDHWYGSWCTLSIPYLYPIYTLSVLPLDFLDFCSPIYTLSIPYLYFHWIFLIFCYPICTLSILYTFIVFSCFLLTLSIPYLYPIYTYLQPTYNLEVFCL